MRVLVVEDEKKLANFVRDGLAQEAFAVDIAFTGEEALELIRATSYDLVVLDIMLPGKDGFAVCRDIRQTNTSLPVLMLSARGMVDDKVRGLDSGADDYLTKPFSLAELTARLRALLRRGGQVVGPVLRVADLELNPATRVVTRGSQRIDLTNREYSLLEYLLRNEGHVLTRAMIAEHVWDFEWHGLSNVIDVYINHLRKKTELSGGPRLIHAVRGAGYVVREPTGDD